MAKVYDLLRFLRPSGWRQLFRVGDMRVLHNPDVPRVRLILTGSLASEVREEEFRHILDVLGFGEGLS